MSCDQIAAEGLAERYLLGQLREQDHAAFERHYFDCKRCFSELQTLEAMRAELRGSAAPAIQLSARRAWWPVWLGAAAAGVLIAAIGFWVMRPGRETRLAQRPGVAGPVAGSPPAVAAPPAPPLTPPPGGTLAGKVVFDAASAPVPFDLTTLRLAMSQAGSNSSASPGGTRVGSSLSALQPVNPSLDGTFRIFGIGPASYTLSVVLPLELRQTWRVRSAVVDGRDLLDETIDGPSVQLAGVKVTLTDKRTELAGTLQSHSGRPVADYFIVVFSQNRRHWRAGARRSQSTRPATNGRYQLSNLPSGEYFLVVLTDLNPDWQEPAFLERAVGSAIKLTIVEGQKTIQDLRVF